MIVPRPDKYEVYLNGIHTEIIFAINHTEESIREGLIADGYSPSVVVKRAPRNPATIEVPDYE